MSWDDFFVMIGFILARTPIQYSEGLRWASERHTHQASNTSSGSGATRALPPRSDLFVVLTPERGHQKLLP